jgi:tRNA 5-methylaminomethyl-2-thiouridine biosynthesis bifunctional protein
VRDALGRPGVNWKGTTLVQRIVHLGGLWTAFDAAGASIAAAPLLVLANAEGALHLAGLPAHWLQRQRGQVSWGDAPAAMPRLPIASGGDVLTLPGGRLLFGATKQSDDDDPSVRAGDHDENCAKGALLIGTTALRSTEALHGRVGWRATTRDRLPLVGPVPDLAAMRPSRADAPRLLPRQPGLWIHSGLGSRGLTTAAVCAELIAAQVSGAPWPLEADLVDAIDPARYLVG